MGLEQARWVQEGLQTDTLSVENGAIMTAASRWSLLIDPQLQGIQWIIRREQPNGLVIMQQSQARYIEQVCPLFSSIRLAFSVSEAGMLTTLVSGMTGGQLH